MSDSHKIVDWSERNLEDIISDVWLRLEYLRRETSGEKYLKWQKYEWSGNAMDSKEGYLLGVIFYSSSIFGRKKLVAEVIISWDKWQNEFSVDVWKKGYNLVRLEKEERDYEPGADYTEKKLEFALRIFEKVVRTLEPLAENNELKENFPKKWIGISGGDIIIEQIIVPNARKIRAIWVAISFTIPLGIFVGWILSMYAVSTSPSVFFSSPLDVMAIPATMFFGFGASVIFLPEELLRVIFPNAAVISLKGKVLVIVCLSFMLWTMWL